MDNYFNGKELYGDDFSIEQIKTWWKEEEEAYANMCGVSLENKSYKDDFSNKLYGFKYISKNILFKKTLGLGSSWGYEFLPIIEKIEELYIIEASSQTISEKLGHIKPAYSKPEISGAISFPNDSFDLICAFSVLHHIPNVSFVLTELLRVLKPGGFLLLREPVITMGDWREERLGLTKNERGIPEKLFTNILKQQNIEIVKKHYLSAMTPFFKRTFKNTTFFDSNTYCLIDKYLSKLLAFNIHYHAKSKIERCAPQEVYYVLRKPEK